jgi:hypothetical protein
MNLRSRIERLEGRLPPVDPPDDDTSEAELLAILRAMGPARELRELVAAHPGSREVIQRAAQLLGWEWAP